MFIIPESSHMQYQSWADLWKHSYQIYLYKKVISIIKSPTLLSQPRAKDGEFFQKHGQNKADFLNRNKENIVIYLKNETKSNMESSQNKNN